MLRIYWDDPYDKARWYNYRTGTFVNRDPIGYAGGDNLYEYVADDPVGRIDPTGLQVGGYPPPSWYDWCAPHHCTQEKINADKKAFKKCVDDAFIAADLKYRQLNQDYRKRWPR